MTLYRRLCDDRHPDYDEAYWNRIEALYAGGKQLLANDAVMRNVFPKHTYESPRIYAERRRRAVYIPYMGQLLDHTVAAVGGDPVKVEGLPADAFYEDFIHDTSGPGGQRVPLNMLGLMQLLRALKFKRAWTQAELPTVPARGDGALPMTQAEEESLGLNRPYLCVVEPCDVLDWEYNDEGELNWLLARKCSLTRPSIDGPRNLMTETYTWYDRAVWRRWVIQYDPAGKTPGMVQPKLDDEVGPGLMGQHSFQKVPFACMEVTEGLWFGNKAESLQREHFNKLSALSWQQLRTLFAFLYVKLAAPDPKNPVTEDVNRDTNQTIGPGHAMRLAAGDDVGYCSPDPAVQEPAMGFVTSIRDEMHRLLTRMSQSIDQSAAALQRSGKSKQVDQGQEAILFERLGTILRDHVHDCLELVMLGRGDQLVASGLGEEDIKLSVTGADSYDDLSFGDLIAAVMQLDTIGIESAEFQVLNKIDLVRRRFPGLSPDVLDLIEEQLRSANTQDDILMRKQTGLEMQMEPDGDEAVPPPAPPKKKRNGVTAKKKAADKKPAKEADNA